MTVREIFENVCQTLMIEKGDNSPPFIRTRIVNDINAAVQMMTTGIDFFTREPVVLSISSGSPSAALPEDTLNIFGPITLGDGSPLTMIGTQGEFQQYPQLFLGYAGPAPAGKPSGIFFDKGHRGSSENSVQITARFSPAPDAAYTVTILMSRRPAAYTVSNLPNSPTVSPAIPVPDKFAESILLPIVRWNVRTSHFFNLPAMLPSMEQEYRAALTQLGLADPKQGPGPRLESILERKKDAARSAARAAYYDAQ